jgi:hypothetical protein
MRTKVSVRVFAVLLAGAAAACSSSPATSTSGSGAAAPTGGAGAGGTASGSGGTTTSAAGGATGGTSNGGSAGQGGTGGADPCKTALLCDDFEAYNPGGAPGGPWAVNQNKGTVAVDTGKAHSGKRAVKVSADASGGYRSAMLVLKNAPFLPTKDGVVYGRMMFFLESAPTGTVHWTFIDGEGPVPGQGYHALYRYGGQHPITQNNMFVGSQLMANYDTPDSYQNPPVGPSSDCWLHSDKKVVPVGAWTCAEWRFDTAANKMQFWLNGTELTDLAMNGTGQGCVHQDASFPWSAPSFERIDLGWESYQADDARVIWIDDVAIDTQRIGCPSP